MQWEGKKFFKWFSTVQFENNLFTVQLGCLVRKMFHGRVLGAAIHYKSRKDLDSIIAKIIR